MSKHIAISSTVSSVVRWAHLPKAIFGDVFDRLTFTERLASEHVCSTWLQLLNTGHGWRTMNVTMKETERYCHDRAPKRLSQVAAMTFDVGSPSSHCKVIDNLGTLSCLRSLTNLGTLPSLRSLTITGDRLRIHTILSGISFPKILRRVKIEVRSNIGAFYGFQFLGELDSIESLSISGVTLSVDALAMLLSNKSTCTSLTELELKYNELWDTTKLSSLVSLRSLSLHATEEGRMAIGGARAIVLRCSLPLLETLKVENVNIVNGKYPNLRRLVVEHYGGNTTALRALITTCASTLSSLEFNDVDVSIGEDTKDPKMFFIGRRELLHVMDPLIRLYPQLETRVRTLSSSFQLDLTKFQLHLKSHISTRSH